MRRVGVAAVALAVLAMACGAEPEVIDVADLPDDEAPAERGSVNVHDADPPDEVPPPDARLASGGWPEAAAFIARESEAGNPTLVNIFASWCTPCRAEMPMLVEAAEANADVTFLGIDHIDRLEDGEAFVDEFAVTFATIHDLEGDVAFHVGSRGMPTTVVFDADGELAGRVIGELTASSLDGLLEAGRAGA